MTLYDAMKASKGFPVSHMYAALWGKSAAESGIKTLTGRLPLFFSTSESKLRDWVIYGNNEPGKNLYYPPNNRTVNGVTFTGDLTNGTVTANGTNTGTSSGSLFYEITNYPDGDYYLSGCADGGSVTTYNIHIFDTATSNRAVSWDETTISDRCYSMSQQVQVHLYSSHSYRITIQVASRYTVSNVVFKPMLRKADTSADFEPYQVGVGEKTKNLLKITGEDELVTRGVTFTHDKSNHTIKVNGQATGNAFYACGEVILKAGVQYVLNGCPAGGSASGTYTYQLYIAGHSDWGSDTGNGLTLPIMTEDTVVTPRIGVYTGAGELTDLVFKPMVREASTSAAFEPYGYVLNIGVGFAPIPAQQPVALLDTRKTIYIGESPLTEGQTLSMSEFGDIDTQPYADMFIAAFEGFNYDSQLSYNQPEMMIKYKE